MHAAVRISKFLGGVFLNIGKDSSQFGKWHCVARRRKWCLEIHCFVDKRLVCENYVGGSKDLMMRGYERTTLLSVHCNIPQNIWIRQLAKCRRIFSPTIRTQHSKLWRATSSMILWLNFNGSLIVFDTSTDLLIFWKLWSPRDEIMELFDLCLYYIVSHIDSSIRPNR